MPNGSGNRSENSMTEDTKCVLRGLPRVFKTVHADFRWEGKNKEKVAKRRRSVKGRCANALMQGLGFIYK